jgi:uncharacterized membrane-anchored protein YitT (DUF2179 family)
MTFAALLIAIGFNMMLVPHRLLSGGVSGIAQMIGYAADLNISILYFSINFPILVWGWFALGRQFVIWSVYSVAAATLAMQFIPVHAIAQDPLLGAVFGGVVFGFGSGLALRFGGSSGGFDIIASIVTRRRDIPIGVLLLVLNGAVIATLGLTTSDWDVAMYSMLSIFVAGKLIDVIHIRQVKVTVFIITSESEKLLEKLLKFPRGVTVIKTRGAYSRSDNDMLMTVTTRYELAALRKMIRTLDKNAFVNVVETIGIMGQFRRN